MRIIDGNLMQGSKAAQAVERLAAFAEEEHVGAVLCLEQRFAVDDSGRASVRFVVTVAGKRCLLTFVETCTWGLWRDLTDNGGAAWTGAVYVERAIVQWLVRKGYVRAGDGLTWCPPCPAVGT